jgi:hypothetical protein
MISMTSQLPIYLSCVGYYAELLKDERSACVRRISSRLMGYYVCGEGVGEVFEIDAGAVVDV